MRLNRVDKRRLAFVDFICWFIALPLGIWLRLEGSWYQENLSSIILFTLISAIVFLVVSTVLSLYNNKSYLASFDEVIALGVSSLVSGLLLLIIQLVFKFPGIPRSVPVISTGAALILHLFVRGLARNLYEIRNVNLLSANKPCLIYGAGRAGEHISRQVIANGAQYSLLGFIDDDPSKFKNKINGKKVLGSLKELDDILQSSPIELILVAIQNLSSQKLETLEIAAKENNCKVKIIPSLSELLEGPIRLSSMNEVREEDLLSRQTHRHIDHRFQNFIKQKKILITGAGGSIGSEVARQLSVFQSTEVFLLDRDESGLLETALSINNNANLRDNNIILADIRDSERIKSVFSSSRFDIVIHAAALKHLNLLERYPEEALKTNYAGSKNIIDSALSNGVPYFVNISTDKAADPISVLGESKLKVEQYVSKIAPGDTFNRKYISVRFGNVLGSKGSFLNTFRKQIDSGGPVTVSHPEVSRFMMSISEAVQLVLQSLIEGEHGEILVLDMGKPVKILDVAKRMIDNSGKPIEIVFTGLSPGEKLHEALIAQDETFTRSKDTPILHILKSEGRDDLGE
jgi:dTDP-glucose 4,6-dehydratase